MPIRPTDSGVRITIRLSPKSSRDKVLGTHGNAIKIAITAPPVEGKANAHLIKFLSKRLRVAKSAITIVGGELSRDKRVDVAGVTAQAARSALLPGEG